MRRIGLALLALSLLFFLPGCQKKGIPEKKITLRYVSYEYFPHQVAIHRAIVDTFNKKQNRIFVKLEIAEKSEKILTQIAGGTPPDVFLWFSGFVDDLARKGAILDLTPYFQESKINKNDYFPELFDLLAYGTGGKIYAFPVSWGADALAYNKDLFDKAGLPYPTDTWTWEDFAKAAQKLTIKKGNRIVQYGTLLPPEHLVMQSYHVTHFDQGLKRSLMDSPDAKKALQFLSDLTHKFQAIPKMAALPRPEQYRSALDMFLTGKVAMYITTSFQVEALLKIKEFRWDIAARPLAPGKKRLNNPGINTLVISSKTKHPKECWEFVKFFCGPEGQRFLGKNCVPAHRGVAYQYFLTPPPDHIRTMIDQYQGVLISPESYTDWGREYYDCYIRELDKLLLGLQSVEETARNIAREGNRFLRPK